MSVLGYTVFGITEASITAREVHDVVAHHVSVMGVQAGAAQRVMARSPDQAAEVLTGIESSSRQAVVELPAASPWWS